MAKVDGSPASTEIFFPVLRQTPRFKVSSMTLPRLMSASAVYWRILPSRLVSTQPQGFQSYASLRGTPLFITIMMPRSSLWKAGKPVPLPMRSTTLRRNLLGFLAML